MDGLRRAEESEHDWPSTDLLRSVAHDAFGLVRLEHERADATRELPIQQLLDYFAKWRFG